MTNLLGPFDLAGCLVGDSLFLISAGRKLPLDDFFIGSVAAIAPCVSALLLLLFFFGAKLELFFADGLAISTDAIRDLAWLEFLWSYLLFRLVGVMFEFACYVLDCNANVAPNTERTGRLIIAWSSNALCLSKVPAP